MRLGVNIDHIATVRQARRGSTPGPVAAARTCELAGATSIVCHLREDRRHIQDDDVRSLKRAVSARFNVEMSLAKSVIAVALAVKPHQVTLVPERRQELTTEGGLDVIRLRAALTRSIPAFRERGIDVSLFVDPQPRQLLASCELGATTIELHTGGYANARTARSRARELETLRRAAHLGTALGLTVAAGHGLDYDNVRPIAQIPQIEELNIGFSIVTRALEVGLGRAVEEMVEIIH